MDFLPVQILTQIVGFLLLLWLLRRYAWGPLLKMLDDRREKIAAEFSGIEITKEDLARLKADYENRMLEIEKEARLKMQEAIAEGGRMAHEITNRARAEADDILTKAKETIQLEMASAKIQMRNEMVSLAMQAAEKVIRRELSAERNRELVMESLEALK